MSKFTQKTPAEILKSLINPNLFIDMQNEKGNTFRLTVEEPNNTRESSLRRFYITGIPSDSIAFTLDDDSYLKSGWILSDRIKNLNKKCDIVVISHSLGKLDVLIGELKSQRPMERNYKFQMINSQLIVDYIVNVMNEYFFSGDIIVKHRFVVFTNSERKKHSLKKRFTYQEESNTERKNLKIGNFFYVDNDEEKAYDDIQSKTNEVWKFNDSIRIQL